MRRYLAMLSVCGAILAGLGCHHVGGKCDCVDFPVQGTCDYYSNIKGSSHGGCTSCGGGNTVQTAAPAAAIAAGN